RRRTPITGPKFDWLTVGRVAIRVRPRALPFEHLGRIGQTPGGNETLERGEPMLVVVRSIVGLAASGSRLQFVGERGRPFLPGEVSGPRERDGERERLCLPRFGEHGTALVPGKPRQR